MSLLKNYEAYELSPYPELMITIYQQRRGEGCHEIANIVALLRLILSYVRRRVSTCKIL